MVPFGWAVSSVPVANPEDRPPKGSVSTLAPPCKNAEDDFVFPNDSSVSRAVGKIMGHLNVPAIAENDCVDGLLLDDGVLGEKLRFGEGHFWVPFVCGFDRTFLGLANRLVKTFLQILKKS